VFTLPSFFCQRHVKGARNANQKKWELHAVPPPSQKHSALQKGYAVELTVALQLNQGAIQRPSCIIGRWCPSLVLSWASKKGRKNAEGMY
jgi:hypothetical protein